MRCACLISARLQYLDSLQLGTQVVRATGINKLVKIFLMLIPSVDGFVRQYGISGGQFAKHM